MARDVETALAETAAEIAAEDAWSAGEAGFLSPYLINCTLPHRDPKTDIFERNVPWMRLRLISQPGVGVPYGVTPRLHIAHVITRAVQEDSGVIELAPTLTAYARLLGLNEGHRTVSLLRNTMHRCWTTTWEVRVEEEISGERRRRHEKVWRLFQGQAYDYDPSRPDDDQIFTPTVYLTPEFCAVLGERKAVPFDLRALRALSSSSLAQDLYLWSTLKAQSQKSPKFYPLTWLMQQFGAGWDPGSREGRKGFKKALTAAAKQVFGIWGELNLSFEPQNGRAGVTLKTTQPHVRPRQRSLVGVGPRDGKDG